MASPAPAPTTAPAAAKTPEAKAPEAKAPAPAPAKALAKAPVKPKTPKQPVIKADAIFPPETLLKKQKALEKNIKALNKAKAQRKIASKAKRQTIFKRNAAYQKEYFDSERALIKAKRDAKKAGSYYVEAQPKLVFVIRIRGINKIPPKPRKVLQLLRLLQINAGVFVRVTKATSELLKLIEPYVAYGYPSYSTIRQLVYKRGYGKVNKQRIPLTENSIIEANLGKYGIISIDDLIHEIVTVGPNFKQANNFLWPFKLSNPSGGWGVRRKFQHFIQGGSFGNREDNINSLIKAMN
ncbi:60S ribosomal uL30 domain-containing protein [Ascoidea rubescens DSM 1968]|uniref:Ribosomal protein L7B n=1 Tax=Ascoidea rubescens DSM 1968 TaxID=1344418 RepID=A0A1D2V8B2_9ASCO|nr:ribosomal protein L7B [Ascoidea rubescens DSM 1968]ODV57860.1 ribosomal protein L7B [Ascoidea rubescens DSM 1968]